MRILIKFDIRNNSVVKGINYEGVEKVGTAFDIYHKVCEYISTHINKYFEIILNDVTASLYDLKSGEKDINYILKNKSYFLPHISSGGIKSMDDIKDKLDNGCDRIMINTSLHDNLELITEIVNKYGAQIIIPSVETRFINGDYYVYKNYGREEVDVKLIDWIKKLKDYGIVDILIISMDKDGTLEGYDRSLLEYLKIAKIFDDGITNCLYAGGISSFDDINIIKNNYTFVKGLSISTMFYKKILNYNLSLNQITNNFIVTKKETDIYFLSYMEGNCLSVMKYFNTSNNCIVVSSVNEIPENATICLSGHYNTFNQVILLKEHNDFYTLKNRINNQTIKYIGICSGLQILLNEVKDENGTNKTEGLNIIPFKIQKSDFPNVCFIDGNFYCHSYEIVDELGNKVYEYIKDNIKAYQYHPENSLLK